MKRGLLAAALWLAGVALCIVVVARTDFRTDLSAFLPRSPTPTQQLLVEQLRDGVASRLILFGIEGAEPGQLANASRQLAALLRTNEGFAYVANGEDSGHEKDREFLWRNRYLLSPAVTPEHFSPASLRASLEDDLQLLGSPAGTLLRRILPADPSGELLRLLDQLQGDARPTTRDGVWFSKDGKRTLLVAQTRASGSDIDAQEHALSEIRGAFAKAAQASGAQLSVSGPGVFSVKSREGIRGDATRFSIIATVLVAAMLFALYRSLRVLVLGFLPVASGALAGIAAVSLGFGSVHGVTLGFGVTLIGEGVDYAIYLFTRMVPGASPQESFGRIWPTLRLGVLTSICGFSAMLLSGFPGLAQLGLFSIAGLIVAAAVTRWVLPNLLPGGFTISVVNTLAPLAMSLVRRAPSLRYALLLLVTSAVAVLAMQRGSLWSDDLASISPVSAADQALDQRLRNDIGAPDVGHLVVIQAKDEESALRASERAVAGLRRAVADGRLQGFESPSFYLPSQEMQRARQAALPDEKILRGNLVAALRGLPFRSDTFEPFIKDAVAARQLPLLDRDSFRGTGIGLKLDALLMKRAQGAMAMLPLRGVSDAGRITAEITREITPEIGPSLEASVMLLDMKRESDQMFRSYRLETLMHSLLGGGAIVILLAAVLRSPRRIYEVLAPLVAALIVTTCVLALLGHKLSIFHLVGLLLVVAVGSNYSLFFERQAPDQDRERTILSLLFASLSTVIAFGLLSLSDASVLNAIGSTVSMGAVMSLVFSAVLCRQQESAKSG